MSLCIIVICIMSFMQVLAIKREEDIYCKVGEDCSVDCDAANSCAGLQINCPVGHSCTIACAQPELCHDTSIDAQYSSSFTLYTNKLFMSGLSIIVPPSVNGKPTAYIYSESNSNDIADDYVPLNPLKLYSTNGFNDIQIISHTKIVHDSPFLGTMYCTESYSQSCDFHHFSGSLSCIDKQHICNQQPPESSRRLLNSDTNATVIAYESTATDTHYTAPTEPTVSATTLKSVFVHFENNVLYQIIAVLIVIMCCFLCCLLYSCKKTNKTSKQIQHLTLRMDELAAHKYSSISSRSPNTPMSFSPFSIISPNTNETTNNIKEEETISFNPIATSTRIPATPSKKKVLSNHSTMTSINTIFYHPEPKPSRSPAIASKYRRKGPQPLQPALPPHVRPLPPRPRPSHRRSNNSSVAFRFGAKRDSKRNSLSNSRHSAATNSPYTAATNSPYTAAANSPATTSVTAPPPIHPHLHDSPSQPGAHTANAPPWTPRTKNSTSLPHVRHAGGNSMISNQFVVQVPEAPPLKETQMASNPLSAAAAAVAHNLDKKRHSNAMRKKRQITATTAASHSYSSTADLSDVQMDEVVNQLVIPKHDNNNSDAHSSIWTDRSVESYIHSGHCLGASRSESTSTCVSATSGLGGSNMNEDSVLGEMLGLSAAKQGTHDTVIRKDEHCEIVIVD